MIDAGIYSNVPRVPSVSEIQQGLMQQDALRLNNQLMVQKAQEYQSQVARAQQVRNALATLAPNATDMDRVTALKNTGTPEGFTQADALEKAMQAQKKSDADIAHTGEQTRELSLKNLQQGTSYAASQLARVNVQDDNSVADMYKDLVDKKILTADQAIKSINGIPPAGPAREQWKQQQQMAGLTMLDQIQRRQEQQRIDETRANNLRVDQRTREEGAANRAVTMRGQNMVDARSREATSAAMSKPFEVTDPTTNQPILVQQDKQGNIRPVEGYGPKAGASKPLTDSQAKALGFGTRMQEADKILNEIGNDYSPAGVNAKNAASKVPLLGGVLEMGANSMLSDNSQRAEQAQRDFVNAILRRESGAAISESEFANARKQYFDQPGDSEALKQQKAANRKLAMEGVLAEVPKGQRGTIGPAANTTSGWSIKQVN